MKACLEALIYRGDRVSIDKGRLEIAPVSRKAVPGEWLEDNSERLIVEILELVGEKGYLYESYSTGSYGECRAGGVTLQFVSLLEGTFAYAVFNARLTYVRGDKKGKALPGRRFSVGKRSRFSEFWRNSGLRFPRSHTLFHDYMGNLRGIVFTGHTDNNRLDKRSLRPLSISAATIARLVIPNAPQTTPEQSANNIQTIAPNSDVLGTELRRGIRPDPSTGNLNHGNTDVRESGIRVGSPSVRPEQQTRREWLDDYESGGEYGH